ncbi:MAG: division/cell wall cluster transcriptional repressor MraZ [Oscillospiraceae bacterium]|nr:division/cell wall cluster transcriptional repressor MraZ [Oscillospiraceae bacterium]
MLVGKAQNTIDASGRIIFPAGFRKEMGEKIYLSKALFDNCLCAYSEEEWKNVCDSLKKFPRAKVRQVESWLFGSACALSPDKQGRVFISGELIEHAGLRQDVVFVGMGSRVEVWDAEKYSKMYSSLDSDEIADILTQLDF